MTTKLLDALNKLRTLPASTCKAPRVYFSTNDSPLTVLREIKTLGLEVQVVLGSYQGNDEISYQMTLLDFIKLVEEDTNANIDFTVYDQESVFVDTASGAFLVYIAVNPSVGTITFLGPTKLVPAGSVGEDVSNFTYFPESRSYLYVPS